MPYQEIYDVSVLLGVDSIDYPGDTPFSREFVQALAEGGVCDLSMLVMSAHAGTHIDTPAHFIPGGKSLEQYSAQDFIRPAHVVEIRDREAVGPHELAQLDILPGDALLFKTENSISGRCRSGVFSKQFVYVSFETASFCVKNKVGLVGLDYITVERYGDDEFPVHQLLMQNEILILEGLDLARVPAGQYTLFCLPLKIQGGEASPVRAILIQE